MEKGTSDPSAVVEAQRTASEFRVLGPVDVVVDGRSLDLGGRKQRTLLALLLLEPGRPVSADRLCDELWHGQPPPGAAKTLRSYISRLRTVLGRDSLATRPSGYALEVAFDQIDAHRFEQLLYQGRDALARGADGLAAERLHAALGLWRGPALSDVADGGALVLEAKRLDELRLVSLEDRIGADLALGRHAELVAELELLVAEEPLREGLWRELVLALYRSGRQADALDAYRRASRLLREELGLEPSEELKRLENAVLRHNVAVVRPAEQRHNIPAQTTSFVGREAELAELDALLRDQRLVTLTGLGGVGKTRLALEVASRQIGVWRDGVWLVDLAALSDPELLTGTISATLSAPERPDLSPQEALLAHLCAFEILVVLDGCEHLAAVCGELAEVALRRAPQLHLLVTSRLPLGVTGEFEFEVAPLAVPAETTSADDILRAPSVRLFLDRGRAVRRDLTATGERLATVAAICRELDGLPLAIELAAAHSKTLSLSEIAARLQDRFRFLRAMRRIADPRHQTLRAAMDWSYELLSEDERRLLRALAVFAGGFTLDAVAGVCLDDDDSAAVELLGRLIDASLVRTDERYGLLETVRHYAAERLVKDPNADELRRQHAEHYLELSESANLSVETLGHGPPRHELVLSELPNLRVAMDWATRANVELGLRLAVSLEYVWVTQDPTEGARRLEPLLERAAGVDVILRARALRTFGGCHDVAGNATRARVAYEQSRELFRQAGDESGVATATFRLGAIARFENDPGLARRLWEESLETFRRVGNRVGELQPLGALGLLELRQGDEERGRAMVATSIEMAREASWVWWEASYLGELAEIALEAGRNEEAEERAREFVELAANMDSRQDVLFGLAMLARAAAGRGDSTRALRLWTAVEAVADGPGRFGQFDRGRYAAAMPAGPRPEAVPLDRAVAIALSGAHRSAASLQHGWANPHSTKRGDG
jgi:predicted ATPase/DNA-binding SARP family transcriptional activator